MFSWRSKIKSDSLSMLKWKEESTLFGNKKGDKNERKLNIEDQN